MHLHKQAAQPLETEYITVTVKEKDFRISSSSAPLFEARSWTVSDNGYLNGCYLQESKYRGEFFHRLAVACPDGRYVDHINRDPTDNRISNLRICSIRENSYNRSIGKNNTSGYKGVFKHRYGWRVLIVKNNKQRYVGIYDSPHMAALAYDAAAREEFGEFAALNFPEGPFFTLEEINNCIVGLS